MDKYRDKNLHEICIEIVAECQKQGKLNFKDEYDEIRFYMTGVNEKLDFECDPKLVDSLRTILCQLKMDLQQPEDEVLFITKNNHNVYEICYGGDGLDYDGYARALGWAVDRVTEEEIKSFIEQINKKEKENNKPTINPKEITEVSKKLTTTEVRRGGQVIRMLIDKIKEIFK